MALLGGAGPAVVAGLCAFAALGYAIYQVSVLTLYVLSASGKCTGKSHSFISSHSCSKSHFVQIICHLRHYNGPVYQVGAH